MTEETAAYHLEPIDPTDLTAGYRPITHIQDSLDQRQLAETMIQAGLPTDVDTVLALLEAEQAAAASLLWEGWDVHAPPYIAETPWPERLVNLQGGTRGGRVTAGADRLAQRMLDHGTPHTRSQIKAYSMAQEQVITHLLLAGCEVESALARIRPKVVGVFTGPDDEYDPQRHELDFEIETLPAATDWLESYRELEKRGLDHTPRPVLDRCEGLSDGLADEHLCPGQTARLCGHWLRFRPSDPRQGIFFAAEDGSMTRQGVAEFQGLHEATFVVPPDLAPGVYWLELRAVILPRDGLQRGILTDRVTLAAAGGG